MRAKIAAEEAEEEEDVGEDATAHTVVAENNRNREAIEEAAGEILPVENEES